MGKTNNLESQFFEAIKKRSDEHKKAFEFAVQEKLYGQMGAIIRQELDSLLRVDYFKRLSEQEKKDTLAKFLANEKRTFPSDANMLETNTIKYELPSKDCDEEIELMLGAMSMGWTRFIYSIGCSLIHLTQLHNSGEVEPQLAFTDEERREIVEGVNCWQKLAMKSSFRISQDFTFNDLVMAAPAAFHKLRSNLIGEY